MHPPQAARVIIVGHMQVALVVCRRPAFGHDLRCRGCSDVERERLWLITHRTRLGHRCREPSASWRCLALLLVLAPLVDGTAPPAAVLGLVAAGALHLGLGDLFLFAAYRTLGPRLALLVSLCCSVPIAVLGEWLVLGALPAWGHLALAGVVIAGVAIALAPSERLRLGRSAVIRGVIVGVLAGAGQACARVVSRVVVDTGVAIGPFHGAAARVAGGLAVAVAAWGVLRACRVRDVAGSYGASLRNDQSNQRAWPWLLASAVIGPGLSIVFLHLAQERLHAGVVQAVLVCLPVVMIPVAWAMDGDRPSVRSVIGGCVAVGAVAAMALV